MQSDKLRGRARRLLARAATRGNIVHTHSVLRAGMGQTNVLYIVVYVISSVLLGGHGLIFFNQFNRQTTTSDYYCYWYGLCQQCCIDGYIPSFRTGLPSPAYSPRNDFIGLRQGHPQNTRTPNYSILDRNSLATRSRHMDEYIKSLIKALANSRRLPHDLPLSKTNLNRSIITKKYINSLNIWQTSDSETIGEVTNNITQSRRKFSSTANTEIAGLAKNVSLSETDFTKSVAPTDHMYIENITKYTDVSSSAAHNVTQLPELLNTTDDVRSIGSTSITVASSASETMASNTSSYEYNHKAKPSTNNFHYGGDLANEPSQSNRQTETDIVFGKFRSTLDRVESKFLSSAFTKLTAISPENRKTNGISFLQSGFFLHQLLMSLTMDISRNITAEIEECLGLNISVREKIEILERTVAWLPKSSDVLKFRWSSRLILRHSLNVSGAHRRGARAMRLNLTWLNATDTAADIAENFNKMVLTDSGGTMHDTFDSEEVAAGVCAAALGTLYVRAAWRSAPTLLNDTLPFRDAPAAPRRSSRFFRLNDLMGYAYLHEWDTEAIEISYATPGLTLLMLVPKEPSLKPLVERVTSNRLDRVLGVMQAMRLAVTLPLYTLRMTLLLPNKLQDMGISSLLTNDTDCDSVKLSHAVQRLMFWAEAGRNAFKDDGIEWDPRPELEIVVDRPYLFFVRWQNITIMNGAFAL